jgi:hypothetical protein
MSRHAPSLGQRRIGTYGYTLVFQPTHHRANHRGFVFEHVLVVEAAMGKLLRRTAPVHHNNEVRTDNSRGNLVACNDNGYHRLLHMRMRSLDACGNANWRQCRYCKRFDDPKNLSIVPKNQNSTGAYHRPCHNAYRLRRQHTAPRKETLV